MDIFIRIKTLGKRKDVLTPTVYELPDDICTLRQLLTAVAEQEAERFCQRADQEPVFPVLTREQLDSQAATGKVSFGMIYSDRRPDLKKAADNALRCWEDGMVRVLMGEMELTDLDAPLSIKENAVFTFIRLTFLTGRLW